MNDIKAVEEINTRQERILRYVLAHNQSSHDDISKSIPEKDRPTRVTISRDLKQLVDFGYLVTDGKTKGIVYSINPQSLFQIPLDIDDYYSQTTDTREVAFPRFNPKVFDCIDKTLFSKDELDFFNKGRDHFQKKITDLNDLYIRKELERFVIELSWKSSRIEGNTYSLLETEDLIKNKVEAKGHDHIEAVMILNHKNLFDKVLENRESYKSISLHDIRAIHAILIENMFVPTGIRESAVGITGTKYVPLDNKWQIEEALNNLLSSMERVQDIPSKALLFLAFISYIQPFVDGNKRTARMVSNSILIANGFYPLSYRSVDEVEFKKSILMFYEQNSLYHLKRIFIEQQKFSIDTYFR